MNRIATPHFTIQTQGHSTETITRPRLPPVYQPAPLGKYGQRITPALQAPPRITISVYRIENCNDRMSIVWRRIGGALRYVFLAYYGARTRGRHE